MHCAHTHHTMLSDKYFTGVGSTTLDTTKYDAYYIVGGGLVLESHDNVTGVARPLACVQLRSSDCNTISVARSEESKHLIGQHDVVTLFERDNSCIGVVISNLTDDRYIKIDVLGENAPRDVVDYRADDGAMLGPGINAVNELRNMESYEIDTDQRTRDAHGRHAVMRIKAARDILAQDGSVMTLEQEAAHGGAMLGASEMFITVTPTIDGRSARWFDESSNTLVWRTTDFIVLERETVRMRGGERVIPQRILDRDKSVCTDESFCVYDSAPESSRTISKGYGTSALSAARVGQGLVSNITSSASETRGVATSTTHVAYNHALRTKPLAVRLCVAGPNIGFISAPPRTAQQLLETLRGEIMGDLTADDVVSSIVCETIAMREAAVKRTMARIDTGEEKVFVSHECVVCLEEQCDTVLLRCMHKCLHAACFEQMRAKQTVTNCPLCRSIVRGCLRQ